MQKTKNYHRKKRLLPAAKGTQLDPAIDIEEGETLFSVMAKDVKPITTPCSDKCSTRLLQVSGAA